jgi:hypothetical protein
LVCTPSNNEGRQSDGQSSSVNRDGAWLTLAGGARKRECSVIDLAPGEAKIAVEPEFEIGDTFELSLVEVHDRRQRREVVWRG